MEQHNWKFLAAVCDYLGKPLAPFFQAIVYDYYLEGKGVLYVANVVKSRMEFEAMEEERTKAIWKAQN